MQVKRPYTINVLKLDTACENLLIILALQNREAAAEQIYLNFDEMKKLFHQEPYCLQIKEFFYHTGFSTVGNIAFKCSNFFSIDSSYVIIYAAGSFGL